MIKNWPARVSAGLGLIVALLAAACEGNGRPPPGDQGIVELDERHLGFDLAGRVREVSVQRGQQVAAGQPLARLDDSLARPARDARAADVEAARAQVDLLRAGARAEDIRGVAAQVGAAEAAQAKVETNLGRARKLLADGAINESEVQNLEHDAKRAAEEVRSLTERLRLLRAGSRTQEVAAAGARLQAAQAALAAEDERLRHHQLTAPMAGTVLDVHLEPGEVAGAGMPVVTVADLTHPYADAFVAIGALGRVKVGGPACVRVDGESAPFDGKIEDIGRHTEFTPRYLFSEKERPHLVVRVRVRIADPETRLHAGIPAFVSWRSCP